MCRSRRPIPVVLCHGTCFTPRPAAQGREACAGIPASAQCHNAPLRTLQSANRPVGQACWLVPRQRHEQPAARARSAPRHATSRARQWPSAAPHAASATARRRRHTAPWPACPPARQPRPGAVLERFGRNRGTVAREGEARLDAVGVDHLARYHLKVALLLPMATADVSAIKPNHDGFRCLN